MGHLTINDKHYKVSSVYSKNAYAIYCIDDILQKYLFIINREKAVHLIFTGLYKVHELIKLIESNTENKEVMALVKKEIKAIKESCYNKKLKRMDNIKLSKIMSQYYEDNHVNLMFLGIKYEGLFDMIHFV